MQCVKNRFQNHLLAILACCLALNAYGQTAAQNVPDMQRTCFELPTDPQKPVTFPDAVSVENGHIQLAVSPQAGRIVYFGFAGQKNLLWINDSQILKSAKVSPTGGAVYNIGGDKMWPSTQSFARSAFGRLGVYPPDGVIDGQPWKLLEKSPRRIVMESPVSPHLGVQIRRTIEMGENSANVKITNRMTRVVSNPFHVHLWTITQVPMARYGLLDLVKNRPAVPEVWTPLSDDPVPYECVQALPAQNAIVLMPTHAIPLKVGTFGRWIAGVYDDCIFMQCTTYTPDVGYADASSAQIFSDLNAKYMELVNW